MKLYKKEFTAGQTIFKYLFMFVGIMLIILWMLHIVMLDDVYKFMKKREIEKVSSTIAANIENDELDSILDYVIEQRNISIAVIDQSRNIIASNDDFFRYGLSEASMEDAYNKLYSSAKASGGITIEINIPEIRKASEKHFAGFDRITQKHPVLKKREVDTILYAQIVKAKSGNEYMIVNSSVISPVDATVDTLEAELIFIAVFLVGLAAFSAFLISKRVTRPIYRMNEATKLLAQGNYDIKFKGDGFRELKELGNTLNYAASELSKSDALRRELMANVSHDLRTPLTMITGYAEVMRDIPGEYTPENVQIIIDESKRLTNLVNDMMDISKLEAGETEIHQTEFDITALVSAVVERYGNFCSQNNYTLEFLHDENVMVYGDELKISQVIYNLINNAVHYCGDDRKVIIKQTVSESNVRIDVIDHGSGIKHEDKPYIWDRYFKSKSIHKRETLGTGLGLSIVKGILDLHNADFGVESEENKGSDFWFVLKRI